jgi:hypothetical protein
MYTIFVIGGHIYIEVNVFVWRRKSNLAAAQKQLADRMWRLGQPSVTFSLSLSPLILLSATDNYHSQVCLINPYYNESHPKYLQQGHSFPLSPQCAWSAMTPFYQNTF